MKDVKQLNLTAGEQTLFEMKLKRSQFLVKNFTSNQITVKLGDNDSYSVIGAGSWERVFNNVEGNPITMANSRKGSFEKEVTEFNLYGWSKQETITGKNLCSIKSCQLSANMVSSDIVPWTKKR